MSAINWTELTASERLVAEQAVMNLRALDKVCDQAKHGTVLAVAEALAMQQGREAIRKTLELSFQRQAEELEKKAVPVACAAAE